MSAPDYSGMKLLFTAFSVAEGSEEIAGYEYVKAHGASDISALYWGDDEHATKMPDDVKKIRVQGNNKFDPKLTEGYDLVFRHQTTRPDLILSPTTTNTNEFFTYCESPIIAVTGTKGKGTTSTLISEILDQAGVGNCLLGNMGNTAIRELDEIDPDDVVVFEISSFQLWDLEHSPHIAVVLMMGVDHQDVHSSVSEYIEAKGRITLFQSSDDLVVYHPKNEMTAAVVGSPKSRMKRYLSNEGADVVDDKIMIDGAEIMWVEQVGLQGAHNLENVCAAITAAWEYTQDTSAISTAVADFAGLEHRLEKVREIEGTTYYNDSFSTAPVAAIAAIRAFTQPVSFIVGGYDKNADFSELAKAVAESTVVKVVVIGEVQEAIAAELEKVGVDSVVQYQGNSMQDIVAAARQDLPENAIVLLSPACASFDMFENYKDRGNQFKTVVQGL